MLYSSSLRLPSVRGRVIRTATLLLALLLIGVPSPGGGVEIRSATHAPTAAVALAAQASASDGLTPAMLHRAYALPAKARHRMTVALVVAFHDPAIQADLSAYSRRFHLPACTLRNRCLRFLNEAGSPSPLPATDQTGGNWNVEHALSTEVVHAICQNCSLLVVEAATDSEYDLSTAVRAAARAGARLIVTTFTPPEAYTDTQYATDYSDPRALVVAASGDGGFAGGVTFPAALPTVLAVGGTHLELDRRGRHRREAAWRSTTSGCSAYQAAASWQRAAARSTGCGSQRALVDVSAVADPGAIIRITGAQGPGTAWYEVGGTSLSAPLIAGVLALADDGGSGAASRLYRAARLHPRALHDVRSGTNAADCHGRRICAALRGYDGPTGLGTPNGLGAFKP